MEWEAWARQIFLLELQYLHLPKLRMENFSLSRKRHVDCKYQHLPALAVDFNEGLCYCHGHSDVGVISFHLPYFR